MLEKLYVSNLAPSVTEDMLADMFGQFGDLHEVAILINQRTGNPRQAARVVLEVDTQETLDELYDSFNGYELEGQRIYVSPFMVPPARPYTDQERADAGEIAKLLNETEQQPRYQILRIRRIGGMAFLRAVYEETIRVEENGGVMTQDGSRRRTTGGVFFFLSRRYLSMKTRRSVFNIGNKQGDDTEKPAKAKKGKAAGDNTKEKGKDKQQKKGKDQAPKAKAAPPENPALTAARKKMAELNAAYQAAQNELDELKAKPREAQKTGLFSATRKVVNIQREISALIKEFPQLGK